MGALLNHPKAAALRMLGFVASDRSELDRFLFATGLSQADVKRVPPCLGYLVAILDFLVTSEAALLHVRVVDQCGLLRRKIGPAASLERGRSHGNASAWPATGATE